MIRLLVRTLRPSCRLVAIASALTACATLAQAAEPKAAPPAAAPPEAIAVAQETFDSYRELRFDDYAKLFRDADKAAFKAFILNSSDLAEQDGSAETMRKELGFASREELAAASEEAAIAAFMRRTVAKTEGFAEYLKETTYKPLGSVADGDDAYVLIKSSDDEVDLAPCHRQPSGEWKLGLKGDFRNSMRILRQVLEWKAEGKTSAEMRKLLAVEFQDAELLGLVLDGKETVYAIVRISERLPGLKIEESSVRMRVIETGSPIWSRLDPKAPASFDDERREAIEADLLDAEKANRAAKESR